MLHTQRHAAHTEAWRRKVHALLPATSHARSNPPHQHAHCRPKLASAAHHALHPTLHPSSSAIPAADISNPGKLTPEQVPVQALYNLKVTQLAFIVACMYTAVGVLRLGFLTNFLSHSVIGGFTSGAAVIIGLSQVGLGRCW
jgi:hypothetical protein